MQPFSDIARIGRHFDEPGFDAEAIRAAYRTHDFAQLWNQLQRFRRENRPEIVRCLADDIYAMASGDGEVFYRNRALNEIEVRERRTELESRPRVMAVSLTTRCNMRCAFCYQGPGKTVADLPAAACRDIADYFPYLQSLIWQGGEVCLHPGFREMIEESARFPQIEHTLLTNGMFLDEGWVALFARLPRLRIALPVESLEKKKYEMLRQGGSFERFQDNVRLLAGTGIKLTINLIVMRCNYAETESLARYAVDRGFSHIIITPLYEIPGGEDFFGREYVSPDDAGIRRELEPAFTRLIAYAAAAGVSVDDRFFGVGKKGSASGDEAAPAARPASAAAVNCRTPWQQLIIDHAGDVRPYCYCPANIGNLRQSRISDIWNGAPARALREKVLKGDLNGCHPLCAAGKIDPLNLMVE